MQAICVNCLELIPDRESMGEDKTVYTPVPILETHEGKNVVVYVEASNTIKEGKVIKVTPRIGMTLKLFDSGYREFVPFKSIFAVEVFDKYVCLCFRCVKNKYETKQETL